MCVLEERQDACEMGRAVYVCVIVCVYLSECMHVQVSERE